MSDISGNYIVRGEMGRIGEGENWRGGDLKRGRLGEGGMVRGEMERLVFGYLVSLFFKV